MRKQPIDPQRIRRIPPEGFSWIDRRFVREGFIEALPEQAIPLYFFLVAVSDAEGLSFYADPTIARLLKLNAEQLTQARATLVDRQLILYRYPIYQVLPLPAKPEPPPRTLSSSPSPPRGGDPVSLSDLLTEALRNARGSGSTHELQETP